jgi:hypothetical protein
MHDQIKPNGKCRWRNLTGGRESQGGEAEEVDGGLGHDGSELGEADDAVAVGVGLAHHVGELGVADGVAHPRHGGRELSCGDEPVPVAVEGAERLCELRLVDGDGGAARPEEQRRQGRRQLVELDGAVSVGVHGGDERVDLVAGGGAEAQRPEKRRDLQLREAAVAVEVEAVEELAELAQLLVAEPRPPAGRRGREEVLAGAGAGAGEGHRRRQLRWRSGGRHGRRRAVRVDACARAAFSDAIFGAGDLLLHAVVAWRQDIVVVPLGCRFQDAAVACVITRRRNWILLCSIFLGMHLCS